MRSTLIVLTLALLACATLASVIPRDASKPAKVGVVIIPEYGHFYPSASVVEELLRRGHHVTFYITGVDGHFLDCAKEAATFKPAPACVTVGKFNTSKITPELITDMVQMSMMESLKFITEEVDAFNAFFGPELLRHWQQEDAERPDVLLVDFGAYSAALVGEVLGIPSVMMWPLVLQMPLQQHPSIPALTLGMSMNMSVGQRWLNYFYQRLLLLVTWLNTRPNDIRASLGGQPADVYELYQRHHIITPSVFGLDIAQPLCPNIHPVGFLTREKGSSLNPTEVPAAWQEWMDKCTGGIVYINMGSVARLPKPWVQKFEDAAHKLVEEGFCVLWKLREQQNLKRPLPALSAHAPLRVVAHVPFTPRHVLKHKHTRVFVTHCGDTSVYETVEFGVPLVGVPLFADQGDMCARVVDSGIGLSVDKSTFTPESLRDAVIKMAGNEKAKEKSLRIAKMGSIQGGPRRAADVLEMVAFHPELSSHFYCGHYNLPWYQQMDLDVSLIVSFILFVLLFSVVSTVKCLFRCVCGKKSTNLKKQKKE